MASFNVSDTEHVQMLIRWHLITHKSSCRCCCCCYYYYYYYNF